jgi:hypothetical protein
VLAVLSTAGDGVRDQMEAGQALSAVVLEAATEGCAAGFLDGPLRRAPSRAKLAALLRRGEVPMLLLRIGHAPCAAPAGRRRVEDLLETPVARD